MTSLHSLAQSAMLGAGSDPRTLLRDTVRSGVGELGGFMPLAIETKPDACPAETKPQMSAHAAGLFRRILGGEFEATLPEFLQLAATHHLLVPPETIPALLGLGRRELRSLVIQVTGERGKWLAAHNPAWAYALEREPQDAWEHGAPLERLSALEQVRAVDPGQARAWVQSTWEQDSPEDRASFLGAFSTGLGMDDEPFLDSCLDDRRKEVRDAARSLLMCLEGSRFVQRNWERARALIRLEPKRLFGKESLHVTLPEGLNPAAKRDGLGGALLRKQLGEKANLLAQTLSFIPPALWAREFDRSPEKLIAAALDCEWKEALLLGWQLAPQHVQDVAWAEAIISSWVTGRGQNVIDADHFDGIAMLVRAEKLETLVQAYVKPLVGELDDKNRLIFLLEKYRRPWTARMARMVVQSAQRQSGAVRYYLPQVLPALALWMPPELAAEFSSGWAAEPKGPWRDRIDMFLMTLNFRNEIQESLKQEAP